MVALAFFLQFVLGLVLAAFGRFLRSTLLGVGGALAYSVPMALVLYELPFTILRPHFLRLRTNPALIAVEAAADLAALALVAAACVGHMRAAAVLREREWGEWREAVARRRLALLAPSVPPRALGPSADRDTGFRPRGRIARRLPEAPPEA